MSNEKFYTIKEAADFLGMQPRTLWKKVKAGKIGAGRVGRQYRISKAQLDAFLDGKAPAPEQNAPASAVTLSVTPGHSDCPDCYHRRKPKYFVTDEDKKRWKTEAEEDRMRDANIGYLADRFSRGIDTERGHIDPQRPAVFRHAEVYPHGEGYGGRIHYFRAGYVVIDGGDPTEILNGIRRSLGLPEQGPEVTEQMKNSIFLYDTLCPKIAPHEVEEKMEKIIENLSFLSQRPGRKIRNEWEEEILHIATIALQDERRETRKPVRGEDELKADRQLHAIRVELGITPDQTQPRPPAPDPIIYGHHASIPPVHFPMTG